mgnify:CR=1 FL=1
MSNVITTEIIRFGLLAAAEEISASVRGGMSAATVGETA